MAEEGGCQGSRAWAKHAPDVRADAEHVPCAEGVLPGAVVVGVWIGCCCVVYGGVCVMLTAVKGLVACVFDCGRVSCLRRGSAEGTGWQRSVAIAALDP